MLGRKVRALRPDRSGPSAPLQPGQKNGGRRQGQGHANDGEHSLSRYMELLHSSQPPKQYSAAKPMDKNGPSGSAARLMQIIAKGWDSSKFISYTRP